MAEGDLTFYNKAKENIVNGEIDLTDDTIKVALMTGHTPNFDTHDTWSDVSGDEISDSSYGGAVTLAGKSLTMNSSSDRIYFDANDAVYTTLDAGTPSHAIAYDDTASNDLLICCWELGSTASNGSDYTLQWPADGLFYVD
jgi:hypothetical protein